MVLSSEKSIEDAYRRFSEGPDCRLSESIDAADLAVLRNVFVRPELQTLIDGLSLQVSNALDQPFLAASHDTIVINKQVLKNPILTAFYLRYAAEIATWQKILSNELTLEQQLICAILSCHTAFSYYEIMIVPENQAVRCHLPGWMQRLQATVQEYHQSGKPESEVVSGISTFWRDLLLLQGYSESAIEALIINDATWNNVLQATTQALPLASPTELIFTQGGDNRLVIDEHTALNQYGCSPRPRPWAITFSSCTSSSVSDIAYQVAEQLRSELRSAIFHGDVIRDYQVHAERIRREIASILGFNRCSGSEVILASSGTDVEFYALHFALGQHAKSVLNIVIAPQEIGSGTMAAAGGRHFDSSTPVGDDVDPGAPVEGMPTTRVRVESFHVRQENGATVPLEDMDREIKALIQSAVDAGEVVLLHLLDHSKTGLRAPSIDMIVAAKRKYGDALLVVVDAAQMRVGKDTLNFYLENEFMILITGSKFFTGPPFSGALVVPPRLAKQVDAMQPFPIGLACYGTQFDTPERWRQLSSKFPAQPNIGLLLRWQAAIWEMQAFFCIEEPKRIAIIEQFGQAAIEQIHRNPDLELVLYPERCEASTNSSANRWDKLQTIFTFYVYMSAVNGQKRALLTYKQARLAYKWLNLDLTLLIPDVIKEDENLLASKSCHIGQPVRVRKEDGDWIGALRIAVGARLVSGVTFDTHLAESVEQRLAAEVNDAVAVFDKLSLIIRYWDALLGAESQQELLSTDSFDKTGKTVNPFI